MNRVHHIARAGRRKHENANGHCGLESRNLVRRSHAIHGVRREVELARHFRIRRGKRREGSATLLTDR